MVSPRLRLTNLLHFPILRTGTDMRSIQPPAEVEHRLEAPAQATGRAKTFSAREAILKRLEDLEDLYLAERWLRGIREGKERAAPLEEVMEFCGLAVGAFPVESAK